MIIPFQDSTSGAAIYINPEYVVTLRPDPGQPDAVTQVKLSDGESFKIRGDHRDVAGRLSRIT